MLKEGNLSLTGAKGRDPDPPSLRMVFISELRLRQTTPRVQHHHWMKVGRFSQVPDCQTSVFESWQNYHWSARAKSQTQRGRVSPEDVLWKGRLVHGPDADDASGADLRDGVVCYLRFLSSVTRTISMISFNYDYPTMGLRVWLTFSYF